jgi:hypothetical protein
MLAVLLLLKTLEQSLFGLVVFALLGRFRGRVSLGDVLVRGLVVDIGRMGSSLEGNSG